MAGPKDQARPVRRIFLWGFMGAGKSTLGRHFARQHKIPFVDLDQWLVRHHGKTIAELFQDLGEAGFRKIEREALETVIDTHQDLVLSCGGGTPCFGNNADLMNRSGMTVFIDPSPGRIVRRLVRNPSDRPLLSGKNAQEIAEYVHLTLARRRRWYEQAQVHLSSLRYPNKKDMLEALENMLSDSPPN